MPKYKAVGFHRVSRNEVAKEVSALKVARVTRGDTKSTLTFVDVGVAPMEVDSSILPFGDVNHYLVTEEDGTLSLLRVDHFEKTFRPGE